MKASIGFCSWRQAIVCAGVGFFAFGVAFAAPQLNDAPKQMKNFGAIQEGPLTTMLILDNATQARGSAATGSSVEAIIFDQPFDSGFGWFMKSDDTFGLTTFASRMVFANGFSAGNSFSSYEATIFHSTSDDVTLGDADFLLELWDGDPYSIMETVCATGGVSAPIPGTQAIATIPWGVAARIRVELAEKVVYGCDRAWISVTMLTGCRAAFRLSGQDGESFNAAPAVGFSNAIWLGWACEAFEACDTDTGSGVGFCCGTEGTCSGSGAACIRPQDCPVGETCDGQELCDHGTAGGATCSTQAAQALTFCGNGQIEYILADFELPDTEEGYVSTLFASATTTLSIIPVSVDTPTGGTAGISGNEVTLTEGNHNVWLEVRVGNWDPNGLGLTLAGVTPRINMDFDALGAISSGDLGSLDVFTGDFNCGVCSDCPNSTCVAGACVGGSNMGAACNDPDSNSECSGDVDCLIGSCSGTGDPCNVATVLLDCPSGETCDGAQACVASSTGNDDCVAALGPGTFCGPLGYFKGSGTCSWTFTNDERDDFVLVDAGATLPALDVSTINSRPSFAVVFGPPAPPSPFPAGGMYAATLAVHVGADAKGTFTLGLVAFPETILDAGGGGSIPLLGVIPSKITVETGRCCFNLQNLADPNLETGCLDGTQSVESCALLDGVTLFTPGAVCGDPPFGPPTCGCVDDEPSTFEDNDACTDNACIAGVPTFTTRVCDDGLFCTVDDCDSDDPTDVGCFTTPLPIDDGLGCSDDSCDEDNDVVVHAFRDPVDDDTCTVDQCNEPAGDITNVKVDDLMIPCATVADCPPEGNTCDGICKCVLCFADLPCSDPDACRATIGVEWDVDCAGGDDKVNVDVMTGPPDPTLNVALINIDAGQFVLNYDPGCMSLNSAGCVAPYDFEIFRSESAGMILLACGVDPFAGVQGPKPGVTLATVSFTKLDSCSSCNTWFTSDNPDNTAFTGRALVSSNQELDGQPICADILADPGIVGTDLLSLDVPGDVTTNTDCDGNTATVTWDSPTVSSACGNVVDLECSGQHESGQDMSALALTGGEHPQGQTTYECWASSGGCGAGSVHASWTVDVSSDMTLDVVVQLSPVLAGDLQRCIKFELFEDCTTPPTVIERNLFFGGLFDFVGHFSDTIKAPAGEGEFACITARDQLHTLRACDTPVCAGGVLSASFRGDPFFDGNWLQNGNLDGWNKDNEFASHDVIDIADFAQFMANFMTSPPRDTPCEEGPSTRTTAHADINGDGIVDGVDLAFVLNNFNDSSKDCCCGAAAGVTVPRTEISVRELRQMGMGELAIADIDGNGLVNLDDITAFLAGDRPIKDAPVRGTKGSGVRSR